MQTNPPAFIVWHRNRREREPAGELSRARPEPASNVDRRKPVVIIKLTRSHLLLTTNRGEPLSAIRPSILPVLCVLTLHMSNMILFFFNYYF